MKYLRLTELETMMKNDLPLILISNPQSYSSDTVRLIVSHHSAMSLPFKIAC